MNRNEPAGQDGRSACCNQGRRKRKIIAMAIQQAGGTLASLCGGKQCQNIPGLLSRQVSTTHQVDTELALHIGTWGFRVHLAQDTPPRGQRRSAPLSASLPSLAIIPLCHSATQPSVWCIVAIYIWLARSYLVLFPCSLPCEPC